MLRTPSVEQAPLLIQKLMITPPNATWPHCVAALARERPRKLELLAVYILNQYFFHSHRSKAAAVLCDQFS